MRRIRVDLIFEDIAEADDTWAAIKNYIKNKKLRNVLEERSFIEYHECHHDSNPPQPCVILERIEKQ